MLERGLTTGYATRQLVIEVLDTRLGEIPVTILATFRTLAESSQNHDVQG